VMQYLARQGIFRDRANRVDLVIRPVALAELVARISS
jgi:hypothetical protein